MRPIAAACAGLLAVASAKAPTQVQLHPTGVDGELSVDFVGTVSAAGSVEFGFAGKSASVPTSSFAFPNIGQLHQAVFGFAQFGIAAGEGAWYRVSADAGATFSANYSITPIAAMPRFAVFGDFGLSNDIIMKQLAVDSSRGLFDYVLHVG